MVSVPETPAVAGRARNGSQEERQTIAARILVADDDPDVRHLLTRLLHEDGHAVETVEDGQEALDVLSSEDFDLVLLDLHMPRVSGLNVLAALPSVQTDAQFIVLTASGTVESAVEAMKLGAHDFLLKPWREGALRPAIGRALEELDTRRELGRLRRAVSGPGVAGILGRTPAMNRVFRLISRVAPTKASVLVTGETGTGKELVARAIHQLSPRADAPFVAVNCSAIPDTLLESELFGHTRGSFTGAVQSRKGLIEEAQGGTLFLDEISTLSQDMQVKLLRVLQDRRVQRVGSNHAVSIDFRLVAATNRDLATLASDGDFREDLYFRLDVFPIEVPPLRHRKEDIPLLTGHFVSRYSEEHGLEAPRIVPGTLARMMAYSWPGNVRELENFIERSVIMYAGRDHFPFDLPRRGTDHQGVEILGEAIDGQWTLDRLEREYLLSTLERNRWQQSAAAEILGVNRRTIHRKLKRYREEGFLTEPN
jgi:DNA-binding NtrC family response regulator